MEKALKFALNFEAKGAKLYLELAGKTKNKLAKELFYSLAQKEIEHARMIDTIYETIKGGGEIAEVKFSTNNKFENELKTFFKQNKKLNFKKDAPNLVGYQKAMEMEKIGYNIYVNLFENSTNSAQRQFFDALRTEEASHLEAITNVYRYLTKPSDWLQEDESHVWNWMSL